MLEIALVHAMVHVTELEMAQSERETEPLALETVRSEHAMERLVPGKEHEMARKVHETAQWVHEKVREMEQSAHEKALQEPAMAHD